MLRGIKVLKEAIDLASLEVDVDIEVSGGGGQTWYGLYVGSQCVPMRSMILAHAQRNLQYGINSQISSSSGHSHITNWHREARWCALQVRVV